MNKRQIPGNNSVFSFLSLLFFLTFSGKGLAQTLTVSSATSSSTGWTFNAGTITVTANSTINSSDINSFLSNGSLTIVGNTSNFAVVINNAITSSVSGNGLTIGALNNAGNITLNSAVAVAGFINMYGGVISLNANLTSSATGNIFLKSISNANGCIVNASGATLTKSGGSGVLTMQGNARIINFGAINATGTGVLDVIIWSDFDNTNNDGGVSQFGSISTNGGHVWLGGSSTAGGSYTWNGLTVGNGPSIGSSGNNANALDLFGNVTTNGGDFLAWAGNGVSGGGNGITNDGNGDVVNVGNGDIILISDVFDGSGTTTLNFRHTGGTFTLVPNDGSFPAAFNWNPTISSGGGFNFPAGDFNYLLIEDPTTLTSLTIGRYEGMLNGSTPVVLTNSSNVTMSTATSIAGPISIYGGALAINSALTATNNMINLHATGAVTQTAALSATSLGLHGTGTFTLNNASNNVATIAGGESGTRLGSLSFTDVSGGLTIGTVGTKSGIFASGTVLVETLTGNILLNESINTSSTSTDAIIINAGKSAAIGTITGGDIIVSGNPTVSTGSNGIAKLFSGFENNSTGLNNLTGNAANNVITGADETTTTFSPTLAANNKYAIYRVDLGKGDLTIVASGGDALNSTWIYKNGLISTISSPVNINASVLVNYLSTAVLTVEAGNITINADVISASNKTLTLRSRGFILQNAGITVQTAAGDIIFTATSSGTAITAGNAAIRLLNGARILSGGGHITLGGGYDGSKGTGLYAASNVTNGKPGIELINSTITAAGGNIKLYGRNISSYEDGVRLQASITTLGSGTIGVYGDAFGGYNGTIYYGGITFTNTSSRIETDQGDIELMGVLTSTQSSSTAGINFYNVNGSGGSNKIEIISKTGDIQITGRKATASSHGIGHSSQGNVHIGSPLDNAWLATGDINFNLSTLNHAVNNGLKVKSTGAISYLPVGTAFDAAMTFPPNNNYQLADSASILTFGSLTNTADITLSSDYTVKGPVSVMGGDVQINGNITSTAAGNLFFQGLSNLWSIRLATGKSITKTIGNGVLTMQGNGRINNGTSVGNILASGSAKLDVVIINEMDNGGDYEVSTGGITTNGGHLWIGSGAKTRKWNGLDVGTRGVPGNTTKNGIEITGNISTNGGDLLLWSFLGAGARSNGYADIVAIGANRNISTGNGDITFLTRYSDYVNGSFDLLINTTGSLSLAPGSSLTFDLSEFSLSGTTTSGTFSGTADLDGLIIQNMGNLGGLSFGTYAGTGLLGDTPYSSSNGSAIKLNSAITIAGPITFHGTNINLSENVTTTSNGADVLIRSNGWIGIFSENKGIQTNNGDIIFWSDIDNNQATVGSVSDEIRLLAGTSLVSAGGKIVLAGGLDNGANGGIAGDGIPDNYAYRGSGGSIGGVELGPLGGTGAVVSLLSGGGDILIRGRSASSGSDPRPGFVSQGNIRIDAGIGRINIQGISSVHHGLEFTFGAVPNIAITSAYAGSGPAIRIAGGSTANIGLLLFNNNLGTGNFLIQSSSTVGGGILLEGSAANASTEAITLSYAANTTSNIQLLSGAGEIILRSSAIDTIITGGLGFIENASQVRYGSRANATVVQGITPSVTSSSVPVLLRGSNIEFDAGKMTTVATTGTFTLEPRPTDNSFAASMTIRNLDLSTVSAFTVGKSTNTSAITLSTGLTTSAPITIYGGALAVNAALTATNNTINLHATGAVTQTAALSATSLGLHGTGTFTLNNTSNNVATIAAGESGTRLGSLSFTDASGGLTIGTVGTKSGIFASGTVLVETLTGDINIEKDISTTNTTATAVTVIAGKSSPVGSIAGGDIKLVGSPNITMGTNGIVRLFSGYESNSPGLNALVGNLINVRNNLISTSTITPGLVNGNKYAIYRLGKGLGDLTIVSSGGDPEGSTWTFDNGVISTQSLNAKLLNTTLQSKFISGDVTIEAQKVTFNANVTNTTNKAFKILAKTHIIDTSTSVVTTISTQGGDVLFATNVDDLTDSDSSVNGYVRFINGINITTNGGDIVMGGGNNGGTGYATGGSESDKHTGIRMDGAIVLNSGGGHIQLKGKSYDINTSSTSFGVGFWNTSGVSTILSGTGKVTIDGFSNSSGGNEMAGIFFSGAVSVTSADTTENAIQLIGKATKNSGQAWGLEANGPLSLIAAGEGGGIKILTSQQRTGDNFDAVFRGTTNILAKSGPIKMLGGQDGGIAGGNFFTDTGANFFIGSKAGSEVTTSSSDIVIQYDSYYFNTYPFVATSGKVNLQPASNNFAISIYSYWFNWNQNSQIMSGFTIGKPGNTADIAIETHPITVAGPIGIYGGYVVVNSNLTSTTNGDIFIKGKSNINYSIGIFGNITKTLGTGTLTLQGDGGVYNDGVIKATGSAKLNIVLWSDFDNDNFGGVRQYDTINTNGGHVWMGGSNSNGGSTIWKGLLVGNGPSVGAGGSNGFALDFFGDVTTNGGELFVWAGNGNDGWHGIVTDANGCNVNTGSGDVTFIADRIWGSSGAAIILNTTGKFTFVPDGSSIPNPPLTWSHNGATNINLSNQFEFLNINNFSSLGGLQIGYYDGMAGIIHNNTSNVTISSPINIAGPISIYGGALAINAALASTNSAINLHAAGAVTQTTALSATSLGLHGTGTFTLNNTSNNVDTIAGGESSARIGSVSFTDANGGLTIGTVGTKSGIFATGTISVETLTGNISLNESVNTTDISPSAITINAGKSAAVGSYTGGNINVLGNPTVTTGVNGIARFFSGIDINSAGLTTLVGGESNARASYDETSNPINPPLLADNKYAIYRTALGTGDLTIVSTGGDAEGTTWRYLNGVISTITNPVNLRDSTLQTKFALGDVSIEANKVTFSANVMNPTANAFKVLSKTHIINTSATTISTQGGDVLLASNVDDATDFESTTNGYIQLRQGVNINTQGGDITLGGGNNLGSAYALGDSIEAFTEGIRIDKMANFNSGGGNIAMRGKTYEREIRAAWGACGLGFFYLNSPDTINSGTGTILLDGYSQTSVSTFASGILFNADTASHPFTIQSANTTANAIRINGKATKNSGDAWGLEAECALSLIATGEGGGITISTSQQRLGDNREAVFRNATNILAKSGPIKLLGGQDGGIAGGFYNIDSSANFFIGSKALSAVTESSSDILIQYDAFNFVKVNSFPNVATSGKLNIQPASNSFTYPINSNWFNWNQNNQMMSGFTMGKPGNTANVIHQVNNITVAGPVALYGGTVSINSNIASTADGDIFLKGSTGSVDLSPINSITKTGGRGTLTMQGHKQVNNGGTIAASSGGLLNVVLWSDFNNIDSCGSVHYGTITTNGGHVWLGGSGSDGGSYTWNGLTVGNGPSVGSQNYNHYAMDLFGNVTTNGGDFLAWAGNGIVNGIGSNGSRDTINTGSGDIILITDQVVGSGTFAIEFTQNGGAFTLVPHNGSFASAFDWNPGVQADLPGGSGYNFTGVFDYLAIGNFANLAGLTIGRYDSMMMGSTPVALTNSSNVTLSTNISINGPISIHGGDIMQNVNLITSATGADVLIKATGDILVGDNDTIRTNAGDAILWADADGVTGSFDGYISLGNGTSIDTRKAADRLANNTTTASGGGQMLLAGGAANTNGIPTGYATSNLRTEPGVRLGAHNNLKGVSLFSGGGDLIVRGAAMANGDTLLGGRGLVAYFGNTLNAGTGTISLAGTSVFNHGIEIGSDGGVGGFSNQFIAGGGIKDSIPAISLFGSSPSSNPAWFGIQIGFATQSTSEKSLFQAPGGGGIDVQSNRLALNATGFLSASGPVKLKVSNGGALNANVFPGGSPYVQDTTYIGSCPTGNCPGSLVTSSTANIEILADTLEIKNNFPLPVSTTGKLTIAPYGSRFASAFSLDNKWVIQNGLTGLQLGKTGNTANITLPTAQTILGPVSLFGGGIFINGPLQASNNNINLHAIDSVTQTASITANGLGLHGTGHFKLQDTLNNVVTIAGGTNLSKIGSLNFVDAAGGLEIGSVNPTGIYSTGSVLIETLNGDINLKEPVSSSSNVNELTGYSGAIVLNAGKNSSKNIAPGGDIKVSGNGAVSAPNGIVKLYGGNADGSLGLNSLVGGFSNIRLFVDESTVTFSPVLSANGIYALYRDKSLCSAENPSSTPTLCINSALTAITIPTSGATRIGTPTGLPTGVSASWAVDTITLTGTPTASGVFNYIIPLEGICGVDASATGRITVIPENTVGAASATPSLCLNTVLTNITHTTTGATGIGSATGLPAGVTANWSSNTITISGTPTNSGVFNYTIPLTGGCGNINATGTITVVEENTVSAGPATNVCLDSVITDITLVTGGASGIGTASGLPAGLTASWASNTITISGTPTVTGTFNYTIPLTGGCGSVNATGTITVITNNTVSVASSAPTLCLNKALTNITHTTTGATGIGIATGLPAGVTVNWASNNITISGTPTEVGTFNYSIPITGGCGTVNATGTITVTPINTVSAASSSQSLCLNTALTNITHTTTGATGVGTATGLPAGVTASWVSNTITISGTPTESGIFAYTIPLTGGCGTVNATGTITVTTNNSVTSASTAPTLCLNTTLTNITHTTTGATGIGSASGLPAGVTASWASNTITISGTPTVSGTFNYTIPLTGGCSSINATGTIIVNPENTVIAVIADSIACLNAAMTSILYTTTGATGIGASTGLPTGVSAGWIANTLTISGTPTVSGTFNYTIPLTGGCGTVNVTGTISVKEIISEKISIHDKSGLTDDDGTICFGESVLLTAKGGASYQWSNGDTAAFLILSPLTTTDYSITITSNDGCTAVEKATVKVNASPAPTVTTTNPDCPQSQTGTATASVGSGWTYLWSNGSSTPVITGLVQGLYALTVTDANGCEGSTSANLVDQSLPMTINASKTDVICQGASTGTITVNVNGGGQPYSYTWSANAGGSTSNILSGLKGGNYSVTVTEGGVYKCKVVSTVEISEPEFGVQAVISLKENSGITSDDGIICQTDLATLSVNATANPGASIVSYLWNDAAASTTSSIQVGTTNTYKVTVTDSKGCSTEASQLISVVSENTVTTASSAPTLCLNTTLTNITHTTTGATGIGTATGLPAGVTASWASNTITISGTPTVSGTFNYAIPLTGGCTSLNATGTIIVNPENTVTVAIADAVTCVNTAMSDIIYTTTGATGIGTSTGLPTGVSAGWIANTITISGTPTVSGTFNYTIPLTGGCGTVNVTGTISVKEIISEKISIHDKSGLTDDDGTICFGESVLLTAKGGASYLWSNGDTAAFLILSPLTTTDYSVTITSNDGCTVVEKATVKVNASPAPTVTTTNPNCPLSQTGTATASAGSGWMYLWSNGSNTPVITGLVQGLYALTVTDANGCEGSTSANLVDQSLPMTISATKTDVLCQGGATGTISVNVNGGGQPYSYAWSSNAGGSTSRILSGLKGGNYSVTVTEAGIYKCKVVSTVEIREPAFGVQAVISLKENSGITSDDGIICQTDLATLSVNATANPGASIVSYLWNDATASTTSSIQVGTTNTYKVTVTDSKGCSTEASQLISVVSENTVTSASSAPTLCLNTTLTNITHTTTGATGIGSASGLPEGVTASWASNTITISGTPTVRGTFNYIIPLTGGCANLNATGTIRVVAESTVSAASSAPALCINTALANITHTTTGTTGIGTSVGLPAGVSANWASNTITISGIPTVSGTFNYTIPLTGGCNNLSATGTIQVNPINTVSAASSTPALCVNTVLTNINHTTTGATGIGTATGLPAGVTASWASNGITISGTPTEVGTFNYNIPLSGGCNNLSATGTIQVKQPVTVSSSSVAPVLCINTAFTNLTHATTGATGIGTATGLPEGVTASFASNTISISGRPTAMGTFNYSIPLIGGCNDIMATGKITVMGENTVSAATNTSTTGSIYIPLSTIVHKTTGALGIGTVSGLPAGVTAIWMSDSIKINGTPTESGTFNYVIPLTGGCGSVNATGTITITTEFNVSELQCGDYMIDNRGIYKGESYDGVIILPYKGGNGAFFTGLTIPSTGVSGLTMVLQPGKLATGNGSLELVIYGVPSDTGNVVFTLPFGKNSCTITLPVTILIPQLSTLNCGSRILNPRGVGKETDYSGELTISYLGGNNGKISPISLTSAGVKGLTLESNAFTLNPQGGNLVFSLKGKPETAGLASFNLTVGDQTCQVMVNVINTEIQIPTYFTPNGDGKNDFWTIPALIFHEEAKVYIFDRTGRLLFEFSGSSQGWNGYIGQYPASAGDYWYVIQLNKEEVRKGNFTLIK